VKKLEIPDRQRRSLLVSVTVLLSLMVALRGVPLWHRLAREILDGASEASAEVRRAEASIAAEKSIRTSLEQLRPQYQTLAPLILRSVTVSDASAALVECVTDAADQAGVRVVSIQVRDDTTRKRSFAVVALRAQLLGDARGIMEMLTELEKGSVLLGIRELTVMQPDPVGAPNRPETLNVDLIADALATARSTRSRPDSKEQSAGVPK